MEQELYELRCSIGVKE